MGGNLNSSLRSGLPESGTGLFIPWWVYLIVILIGLGLTVFFLIQSASAKRRATVPLQPGAPPPLPGAAPVGNGKGYLIAGIVSALLLVLAPLIVMLILQPWNGGGSWIVGRWSERPGCGGDIVEFTRDGNIIAERGSGPYRLEGDRLTFNGRTEMVSHSGDSFAIDNETLYRCSGSDSATAGGTSAPFRTPSPPSPTPTPYAPPSMPSPQGPPASTPTPEYASWLIGRWSDSNCQRSMEFRADGSATTANGQLATYRVYPNGQGVHITIDSAGQQIAGYMDRTPSGAILRAYRPSARTVTLSRC